MVAMLLTFTLQIPIVAQATTYSKSTSQESQILEPEVAETEIQESPPNLITYEKRQYIVPNISLNRQPGVSASGYVEKFTEVPQYFQTYYPKTRYGDSTVRKSGCGITSLAMVLTYLLDEEITPDYLAEKYSIYKVEGGSSYSLFSASAEDYGITIEKQSWQWEDVMAALKKGQVVIANPKAPSVFTKGGHFIVLYGITDDGRILVRDPNLYNYSIEASPILEDGFANGFEEKSLKYTCFPCWIYAPKDLNSIAERIEKQNLELQESEPSLESTP